MEISFSQHAITKMNERDISQDLVTETVKNPDLVRFARLGRKELYKKYGKLHLKVVIGEDDVTTVITAHWVGRLK